jgi:hypothetical protein
MHCLTDWSRLFDDPIALPDGRVLRTLAVAAWRIGKLANITSI